MTREKALEAMDRFVAMGYTVQLSERDVGAHGHVFIGDDGKVTSLQRWLTITEISIDKVDLRAIVAACDELDLNVGIDRLGGLGNLRLTDMPTEAEQHKQQVVGGRRPHPR